MTASRPPDLATSGPLSGDERSRARHIAKVLVANRGEIARRIIRTCADLGISTVAVHSDADADAPFVREADRAVRLPGDAPADTYLRGDLVVAAAQAAGADAVHPGYGFLSENADFAQAVVDAGLTWIGPRPATIQAMGSKIRAKELMAAAGVPILSGDDDRYPKLVKASAGGGGRGMRVVADAASLDAEVAAARAEALSAFGDGTVFVEPYLPTARHIEVQVLADEHGTCWVLGERDCSIQRRHQKVVEETPAPGITESTRTALYDAARAAVDAVDYVGAGTVEFLVDSGDEHQGSVDGGDVWFLEMNTRLQVEHPVTECVTGADLVALQVAVAEGRALGSEPTGPGGHAVEVRLYAESPAEDWRPQTGTIRTLEIAGVRAEFGPLDRHGIRVDSGFEAGSEVGIHYDPMLAKVVAWGVDRADAVRRLRGALARTRVHGVATNLDLLVAVLGDEEFAAGRVHTGLLAERLEAWTAPRLTDDVVRRYAAAAALAQADAGIGPFPAAFRNVRSQPRTRRYRQGDDEVSVAYGSTRGRFVLAGDDVPDVVAVDDGVVRLAVDGVTETYVVAEGPGVVDVDGPYGSLTLEVVPRFVDPAEQVASGSLLAPMPATVTAVEVAPGQAVAKGDTVLVLEAMKMQHTLTAPEDGVVAEVAVVPGTQVESGAVLAVIEPDPDTHHTPQENAHA